MLYCLECRYRASDGDFNRPVTDSMVDLKVYMARELAQEALPDFKERMTERLKIIYGKRWRVTTSFNILAMDL